MIAKNWLKIIMPSLAVAIAGAAAAEPTKDDMPAPSPAIAQLKLPDGPLLGVSGNERHANFIETDQTSRHNDLVEVTIFIVYTPGLPMRGHLASQMVRRERYDCAKRTQTELGAQAFDDAGRLVMWLPAYPPENIREGAAEDYVAKVVCDGVSLPPTNTVIGHAAAMRVAHEMVPH